jgi:hypothetical protein
VGAVAPKKGARSVRAIRLRGCGAALLDLDCVDYSYDRRVGWAVLTSKGHSGRASLDNKDNLADSGANGIDGDQVPFFILTVNSNRPDNEQFAPKQALVFSGCHHRPNYSTQDHSNIRIRRRAVYFSRESKVTGKFSSTDECGRGIT